ncbi:MAG: PP2C family protein-serine/threonine phosphatase [Desulfatirhabdiaceae bacterium]|nr:PP2C family protein-serine/threonine phosphatase [Desulfatirhabdiaceae bacterium]
MTHSNMTSFPFRDRRNPGADTAACVHEILKYRAMLQDNRLHNRFLKELVNNYSQAQLRLAAMNRSLSEHRSRLDEDLRAAAGIQKSLLPQILPRISGMEMAWRFTPSETIGGDLLNVYLLDEHHLGIYVLDVSGHGVHAALVTVSVSQMLLPHTGLVVRKKTAAGYEITPPAAVMALLDEEYPLERFDTFFSIIYIVLDVRDGSFAICNAGHVPALLFRRNGRIETLKKGGTVIGLDGIVPFEQQQDTMYKGDRLLLYTDGVTEFMNSRQQLFGKERLIRVAGSLQNRPMEEMVNGIYEALVTFGDGFPIQDDVSILGIAR